MTNICLKNIGRATKKTYKLIDGFFNDVEKRHNNPNAGVELKDEYREVIHLNKSYKLEIIVTPDGTTNVDLIYYILNDKGIAIDQVHPGVIFFNLDYDKLIAKDLSYLLNMYC